MFCIKYNVVHAINVERVVRCRPSAPHPCSPVIRETTEVEVSLMAVAWFLSFPLKISSNSNFPKHPADLCIRTGHKAGFTVPSQQHNKYRRMASGIK